MTDQGGEKAGPYKFNDPLVVNGKKWFLDSNGDVAIANAAYAAGRASRDGLRKILDSFAKGGCACQWTAGGERFFQCCTCEIKEALAQDAQAKG